MSRHIYRLCNTSHIQSKPANAKILSTIVYWIGQLFSKPRLTMVCITPGYPQLQQASTANRLVSANHPILASQKIQANTIENALDESQNPTDKCPATPHSTTSSIGNAVTLTEQPISISGSPLTKAGQKADLLCLKVYNGPIFQDKKVDQTVKTQAQPSTQASFAAQSVFSVQNPSCLPHHGLYPACLQMLNKPKQGKKPVFISGKMSDIFAQLDQLAA